MRSTPGPPLTQHTNKWTTIGDASKEGIQKRLHRFGISVGCHLPYCFALRGYLRQETIPFNITSIMIYYIVVVTKKNAEEG